MIYIHLFSCCVLVRGVNQSLICDLQRRSYEIIPNSLFEILSNIKIENCFENLIQQFDDDEDKETFRSYINFLDEKEFIFIDDTKIDILTNINLEEFDLPCIISNSIIDYDYSYKIELLDGVIEQLDELRCQAIELRFFKLKSKKIVSQILKKFKDTGIRSISIVMPFLKGMDKKYFESISINQPRVREISLFEVFDDDLDFLKNSIYPVYLLEDDIVNVKKCGYISDKSFYINIQNFTESKKHNSCLNRKLSIDAKGEVRNCPSMSQSFGNVKDTTLEEALCHSDFKKYWNITKDQIEVCKDCEFRHICTDCRAYIEQPDNQYSKPLKCGYNPYTNVWEEWSTNPLKQKAIEYYGMQDLVKKDA